MVVTMGCERQAAPDAMAATDRRSYSAFLVACTKTMLTLLANVVGGIAEPDPPIFVSIDD